MHLFIPGHPKPQGRPRAHVHGKHARVHSPTTQWREDVRYTLQKDWEGEPLTVPVQLHLAFYFERPKSHYRTGKNAHLLKDSAPDYPMEQRRGDADNLAKGIMDAANGILYLDDAQVVTLAATKCWAMEKGTSGVHIYLHTMEHAPLVRWKEGAA